MEERAEPFSELPDALVEEMLGNVPKLVEDAKKAFDEVNKLREPLRDALKKKNLLKNDRDLELVKEPTSCGIDGSYSVERLTALDIAAVAAVAVEGICREEKRYWEKPHHMFQSFSLSHSDGTALILRGMMMGMEITLASKSPHDIVMLDGSFISILIYLNQAREAGDRDRKLLAPLIEGFLKKNEILKAFSEFFNGHKNIIALPKFTSRRDIIDEIRPDAPTSFDGKAIMTLILQDGEFTAPVNCVGEKEQFHLKTIDKIEEESVDFITKSLKNLKVIYYKPYGWSPAVRIELPERVAQSSNLNLVLRGVRDQIQSPAIREPYPLFMADRMVQGLGTGLQAQLQAVSQGVIEQFGNEDVPRILQSIQSYRTETGRG